MKSISLKDIQITGGFWAYRQELNYEATLPTVYQQFLKTGRFDAFQCSWRKGMPNKPHFFWDSDVAKWMEGASYCLLAHDDPIIEKIIDRVVENIAANAEPTGYFNSYYLSIEKSNRWTDRGRHELYCAGHLIEAAVAYFDATGKDKFLHLMRAYADEIYRVFIVERSAAFSSPGHEEIELALVKLYHCTKESRYLDLARFFLNERGTEVKATDDEFRQSRAIQSHLPVREQKTAEGHSVRALYLYSAMADLAKIDNDADLLDSCQKIFDDILFHKMYLTGGVGSTRAYEGFTINYDLPSEKAYTETCAAIAMCFFCKRMLEIEADSRYADICELEFYNGFLSSTSLDGKAFFYENPLELQPKLKGRLVAAMSHEQEPTPLYERRENFWCSCCPSNIVRFVPSFGEYLYNYDDSTVFVHHSAQSTAQFGGTLIIQETNYPNSGTIILRIQNASRLALRIPFWCDSFRISVNGKKVVPSLQKGYAYLDIFGDAVVVLELERKVQLIEANPEVVSCAGKLCVRKGVFIYCLEAVDNGENLNCLRISPNVSFSSRYDDFYKTEVLESMAWKSSGDSRSLYHPLSEEKEVPIKLIPYYAFANRGESEMIVWINRK